MHITMNSGARELAQQLADRAGVPTVEVALVGAIQTGLLVLESATPLPPIAAGAAREVFIIEPTADQIQRAEQLAALRRVDWADMPTGRVLAAAAQIGLEKLTRTGPGFRVGRPMVGPRSSMAVAS